MSFGNPFAAYKDDSGAQCLGYNGFEVSLNYVTGVPDPNIVSNSTLKLIFKSLLKRDEMTKEKALNELVQFIKMENVRELKDDLVLITWIQLYPKLSISESKTVRLLSHQVQISFISTLQKHYVKYLKDSIPILLTGFYDFDSSLVNSIIKNLNVAFNNDIVKINNLWFFFQSEILNFVDQVLNKETVDSLSDDRFIAKNEAELKYLRLVNATISLIAHLIQLSNKVDISKINKSITKLQKLFTYENLWKYLFINSNINNQRIFKTIISLITTVLKTKPYLFTEKAWKLLSKRFIKSLTFVKMLNSSFDTVHYSSLIIPIITTLNLLNEANPEFYQYDKAYKDRIMEFLKIGSLSSNASYYSYLFQFLKSSQVFDLKKDSKLIQKILLNDFETEVNMNLKFRQRNDFIIDSLNTYLKIAKELDEEEYLKIILDKALEIKSPITSFFINPISQYVPSSIIIAKLSELPSFNLIPLLNIALKSNVSLKHTLSISFEELTQRAEQDEKGESFKTHPAFEIFDFVIQNDLVDYSDIVDKFIDELPTFIVPSVIEKPINILISLSKSKLYKKNLFIETFDNVIFKLNILNSKPSLISRLDLFVNKSELLANSEELQNAVSDASKTYKFDNDELFKPHFVTIDSLIKLYELAVTQKKINAFVKFFLKYNSENDELLEALIQSTDFLSSVWELPNKQLFSKLKSLINNEDIKAIFFQNLKDFVSKNGSNHEITSFVSELLESNPSLATGLFNSSSIEEFKESYGGVIDSRLALGNPLESNIYLLSTDENSFKFDKLAQLLRFALFLNSLIFEWDNEALIYLGILSEVGTDYEFLINGKSGFATDALFEFKQSMDKKLLKLNNDSYAEIVSKIIGKLPVNTLIDSLLNEFNEVIVFYKTRLLKLILSASPSSFSELDIDSYTKEQIRSKDSIAILRFVIIISTFFELRPNSKFERTKNLVASELIGLKPSEILNKGLTKLIILNNFLVHETELVIQQQRFNMIINEFLKWLDSDAAYEPEFQVLRIQLLQFVTSLNTLEFDKNVNFRELTNRLLQESTELINIGEGKNLLELKYHALKLYLVLKKKDELEKDVLQGAENEILESYLNDTTTETSQPFIVYNELLNRLVLNLPIIKFKEHYETLLKKYQDSKFEEKRTLLSIIEKLIISKQQDLVIEYELSKNKEDLIKFNISKVFVDNVLKIPDFQDEDDEDDKKLISYLWSWVLVLLHFKDITLNLRSLYIQQLQNDNNELITKFLNFISLIIVDIDDKIFLTSLENSHDKFINYDFTVEESTTAEIRLLSIYLFYTILDCVGSLSANWFHNIKDRGFKAKIEQFTSKYISPNLIKYKLDTFNSKISNIKKNGDNLTIKINRVTNEIKSIYLIDEQCLELIFRIPSNFPLSNIEVLGPHRVGVKETQWKAWLLASQRIVSLQNGEISESLEFFLKNIKFHFKGFEECAICYSILHQDNSLPSKICATCKNKFHSGCLYKWFKSSGASTCPLCRSTFNFR